MFVNPYKFIGQEDYKHFMDQQDSSWLKKKNTDSGSFDSMIRSLQADWNFSFDDILDSLINYLIENGWIDTEGNVVSVPTSADISDEDFSILSDEIVAMLQSASDDSLMITTDALSKYGITWDQFSPDGETSVAATNAELNEEETLVAAGYYNALSNTEKAISNEYHSFMFFTLKIALQTFGKMNKKHYDKRKEVKKETEQAEQKAMAQLEQQIAKSAAKLRKGGNKKKQTEDKGN